MKLPRWPHKNRDRIVSAARSDTGLVREENQDSYGIFGSGPEDRLFIVADGMGGHERGQEASLLAVRTVNDHFYSDSDAPVKEKLHRAIEEADRVIHESSKKTGDETQMGTTCTLFAVVGDEYWVAHVGDSRAYHVTPKRIVQLTTDHTFVNQLVKDGVISEHQAQNDTRRHTLLQALGIGVPLDPEILAIPKPGRGDKIILCSDGLAEVSEDEIAGIARKQDVDDCCRELIELANQRGGADNTTVVAVEMLH